MLLALFFAAACGTMTPDKVLLEWDFHDGTPRQTGQVVHHGYGHAYVGNVTLTITNPQQTLVLNDSIAVTIPPAGWDGWNPLYVEMLVNAAYCSWSSGLFDIDFGDGTVLKGVQSPAIHRYLKPGVYTITLTLANGVRPSPSVAPDYPWTAQVVVTSVPRSRAARH